MTAQVAKNLALLSDAPGGLATLRELILDLAANGRLGGPGAGWRATQLRELVVSSGAGWSPSCEARPRSGNEWGVLKVSAVSWGQFQPDENKALPVSLAPRPELEVQAGAFLVSRANTAELVARSVVVESAPPKLMLSDKIVRLRLSGSCDPRFVQIANSAPEARRYYARVAGGTSSSMKNVSREQILSLPILLPSIVEQHRIVAKVDELMALCDRLEARQQDAESAHARLVQALLGSLTQARDADEFQACWQRVAAQFLVLFTTPASINGLWSAVLYLAAEGKLVAADERAAQLPIGELLLGDTLNGCSYKPSDTPVGIPILRISAGTGSDDFIVDETDHKWVEVTAAEREKFRLQPNDLLACRFNGNLHYVGAFALYNGASGVEQIFPDKLIRFRVDDKRALPGYLRFVMNALPARQQIECFCATTVGNIGISATNLKTVKVRVPSLDEQRRIVAKVTELLALRDQLKARITAARAKHKQLAEALVAQAAGA